MNQTCHRFLKAFGYGLGVLFVMLGTGRAQDVITLSHHYQQSDGTCCWDFSVKNANTQGQVINKIIVTLQGNDGTIFTSAGSKDATWNPTNPDDHTSSYVAGGSSIAVGSTVSGFNFCLQMGIDASPEALSVTTYNNSTALSTSALSLVCTPYQSFNKLDTVTVVASQAGTDPCFRFKVTNRNDNFTAIDHMVFETLDPQEGYIRPSSVRAPSGWTLDSVTPNRVYFSTFNAIDNGKSVDSFFICLFGNPNLTKYGWVWRAVSGEALIDRDTIRNIAATASSSSTGSPDQVTATNRFGCLYTINLKNYHVTARTLPSRLTGLIINSSTPGVTIASAPTVPAHWAKSISSHADTVYFQAGSDSDGVASGVVLSDFGLSLDNPSGNAFTLHWQTLRAGSVISSGDLNLTCSTGASLSDTAVVAPNNGCCYKLTLQNRHNSPPSNDYGFSLAIGDGSGTFDPTTGTLFTSQAWNVSLSPDNTSVRFSTPSGSTNFQPSGASQTVFFCVKPKTSGQPVTVQYQSYDASAVATSPAQSFAVTCSVVSSVCDSVRYMTTNANSCLQSFAVLNRRATPVTKVVASPLMGWKIDTAFAPIPWTAKVDPSNLFVTFSASPGIASNSEQTGFSIAFSGQKTSNSFAVQFATTNDAGVCLDTLQITCMASGVGEHLAQAGSLKLVASPNPFHEATDLTLTMPVSAKTTVELVDLLGRSVKVLANEELTQGTHVFHIEGAGLAAGTYYVRVQSLVGLVTKKIVLAK